jgi:hypothetical protein
MRLIVLPFLISLEACGSGQRSDVPQQADSTSQVGVARRPCGSAGPCSDWTIHTPAFDRGEEPARFAGSFRTLGSRVFVWLDTASGTGRTPADSIVADLRPGERLEVSCGMKGRTLEGRVVAIVRDTTPRLAWQFDLDARRIRSASPDSVHCEREYAGD